MGELYWHPPQLTTQESTQNSCGPKPFSFSSQPLYTRGGKTFIRSRTAHTNTHFKACSLLSACAKRHPHARTQMSECRFIEMTALFFARVCQRRFFYRISQRHFENFRARARAHADGEKKKEKPLFSSSCQITQMQVSKSHRVLDKTKQVKKKPPKFMAMLMWGKKWLPIMFSSSASIRQQQQIGNYTA